MRRNGTGLTQRQAVQLLWQRPCIVPERNPLGRALRFAAYLHRSGARLI